MAAPAANTVGTEANTPVCCAAGGAVEAMAVDAVAKAGGGGAGTIRTAEVWLGRGAVRAVGGATASSGGADRSDIRGTGRILAGGNAGCCEITGLGGCAESFTGTALVAGGVRTSW